jgi:hypothetical protein
MMKKAVMVIKRAAKVKPINNIKINLNYIRLENSHMSTYRQQLTGQLAIIPVIVRLKRHERTQVQQKETIYFSIND